MATAFGAVLAVKPLLALIALIIVAIVVLISKRMSLGSIIGAIAFAILAIFLEPGFFPYAAVMAIIMLIKHRANIVRLAHGEEPIMSIFEKKDKSNEGGQEDE